MKTKRTIFLAVLVLEVLFLSSRCVIFLWGIWHDRGMKLTDQVSLTSQVIQGFVVLTASVSGALTLMATLTPRWLSYFFGIGPDLTLEWKEDDPGYVHEWDRFLVDKKKYPDGVDASAVIIRMAVRNDGVMAAESAKVVLETIQAESDDRQRVKFSPLRWADSYDLEQFEKVEHHRCATTVEPLIHAGSKQFIDFAFIFARNSPFYELSATGKKGWCVHPFYQWLPAKRENAVLDPGNRYKLTLALSAKNFHTVRYLVKIDCWESVEMPDEKAFRGFKVVGLKKEVSSIEGDCSTCPVEISEPRKI